MSEAHLNELLIDGYILLSKDIFFANQSCISSALTSIHCLYERLDDLGDQPGCRRAAMDALGRVDLLYPWIANQLSLDVIRGYFHCHRLLINFVRIREPIRDSGAQELHRDWHANEPRSHCELFIALDHINYANGAVEVHSLNGRSRMLVNMNAGDLLIMDSTVQHRGTLNSSGMRRRLLDVQISACSESCAHAISCIG
jgi:hypothetical protein